jgi:hypothetical protein
MLRGDCRPICGNGRGGRRWVGGQRLAFMGRPSWAGGVKRGTANRQGGRAEAPPGHLFVPGVRPTRDASVACIVSQGLAEAGEAPQELPSYVRWPLGSQLPALCLARDHHLFDLPAMLHAARLTACSRHWQAIPRFCAKYALRPNTFRYTNRPRSALCASFYHL